jgi:hypothetical protein
MEKLKALDLDKAYSHIKTVMAKQGAGLEGEIPF